MTTQLYPRQEGAPKDAALRSADPRLSEAVRWLLAHEALDTSLQSNSHFFPAFMERLGQTLDKAFRDGCERALFETHRALFFLYEDSIGTPRPGLGRNQFHPFIMRIRNEIESAWEAAERGRIDLSTAEVPTSEAAFAGFMRELCEARTLASHPLFTFLEQDADRQQMVAFFQHEGLLILRFYDLMVLSMLGVDEDVREELSANLWDEVGNGNFQNRHTELFRRLLGHAGLKLPETPQVPEELSGRLDWQGLAGYNLYVYFGLHRRNYYKFVGGMGAAEYMDSAQYVRILRGCRRVGLTDPQALAYYADHAELDAEHGEAWIAKVMVPLVRKYPEAGREMAAGAVMRINTTAAYYDSLHRKLNAGTGRA